MRRVAFTWDERKAASNTRKHRISFTLGAQVFFDPHVTMEPDRIVDGEERWRAIAWATPSALLTVAYISWDEDDGTEVYRIISARPATVLKGKSMKKVPEGWVRIEGRPELTPEDVERLKALEPSNAPIDLSDLPDIDESFSERVRRRRAAARTAAE